MRHLVGEVPMYKLSHPGAHGLSFTPQWQTVSGQDLLIHPNRPGTPIVIVISRYEELCWGMLRERAFKYPRENHLKADHREEKQ